VLSVVIGQSPCFADDLRLEWTVTGVAFELHNGTRYTNNLFIPPFTLLPGFNYSVIFKAQSASDVTAWNTLRVTLVVVYSGVLASISGGDRTVGDDNDVVLSASQSHDPDQLGEPLSFLWYVLF